MTTKKRSFWDRLMTAVKARDEEAVMAELAAKDEEAEEAKPDTENKPSENTQDDPLAEFGARLEKIEAILAKLISAEEAEHGEQFDKDGDPESKETDDTVLEAETAEKADDGKTYTGDSLKVIASRAEILAPGIAIHVGDGAKAKGAGQALMKKSLESAYATEHGRSCIDPFLLGRKLSALTGDSLRGVFNGSAELMRLRNNDKGVRSGVTTSDFGKATTVSDINSRNKTFWANRSAR